MTVQTFGKVRPFPQPAVPPLEARAVWCDGCSSLVRMGVAPMRSVKWCDRCTQPAPTVESSGFLRGVAAVILVLLALAIATGASYVDPEAHTYAIPAAPGGLR